MGEVKRPGGEREGERGRRLKVNIHGASHRDRPKGHTSTI
jgi:hypothetical protein